MAILTPHQLDDVRQQYVKEHGVATLTKPQLNAAVQAVEDVFTSTTVRNAINSAINTATSPAVLTAEQKRVLVRWVLRSRFDRGNE